MLRFPQEQIQIQNFYILSIKEIRYCKELEVESENLGSRESWTLICEKALANSFNLPICSDIIKEARLDDV